ncbi:MAG: hypothetical protein HYV63_03955 [Candidatus Schekmanbacteria bacterium]|nr:hypothetical protein [Candidatus Schekmanbacteria bacterium]
MNNSALLDVAERQEELTAGASRAYPPAFPPACGGDEAGAEVARDLPGSARLARLRQALLAAPYAVCAQKAILMTRYLAGAPAGSLFARGLSAAHFGLYRKSLEATAAGACQPAWKSRLNTSLLAYYRRREGLTPARRLVLFAEALAYILDNMALRVYDDELIVGNLSSHRIGAPLHPDYGALLLLPELDGIATRAENPLRLSGADRTALHDEVFPFWFDRSVLAMMPSFSDDPELMNTLMEGVSFVLTQFSGISHLTPDYPTVLRKGFAGIAEDIEMARAEAARERAGASSKRDRTALDGRLAFYEAAAIVTSAARRYGRRWAAHLRAAAGEAESGRRLELEALAEICERVPERPARTFHEALQSLFLTHVIVHQESFQHGVSFGRVDQYLRPFYESDVAAGRLSKERAVELIGCFLGKAAELLPLFFARATEYFSGLSSASGLTLGGTLPDGSDAVNELSFLFLNAYDLMRLRQPNIHVRVHPRSDQQFLTLCYETLKKGSGIPALFNDEQIVPALERAGYARADAEEYAVVGCAEWGVPHCTFQAAGAGFINAAYPLVLALHEGSWLGTKVGPKTAPVTAMRSMADLLAAYRAQLAGQVARAIAGNNAIERAHAAYRPTPFLSAIVGGCIAKGRDVTWGGAIYNPSGMQGVGVADAADSLAAIEELVFRRREISLSMLVAAVDANFEQDSPLRCTLLNRVPKYGENRGRVDTHVAWLTAAFAAEVQRHRNPRGGSYIAGFWTMTTHQGFGRRMGALPSGRRAGEALANGVSPSNGRDRRGPTASLSAAASVVAAGVGNGYVLNQKLDPAYVRGSHGTLIMDGLVRGYFRKGGMQVQFNIIDPAVLLDARAHPERHRDLVVRISGYSAYFNDLTEAMKDEIIARTVHGSC